MKCVSANKKEINEKLQIVKITEKNSSMKIVCLHNNMCIHRFTGSIFIDFK